MKQNQTVFARWMLVITCALVALCANAEPSVKDTMDTVVTRMYQTLDEAALSSLDDAAVQAARTLRALPDSAAREALLPVRFRLR